MHIFHEPVRIDYPMMSFLGVLGYMLAPVKVLFMNMGSIAVNAHHSVTLSE